MVGGVAGDTGIIQEGREVVGQGVRRVVGQVGRHKNSGARRCKRAGLRPRVVVISSSKWDHILFLREVLWRRHKRVSGTPIGEVGDLVGKSPRNIFMWLEGQGSTVNVGQTTADITPHIGQGSQRGTRRQFV